jgi:DNA-binding NtrC family response regulator
MYDENGSVAYVVGILRDVTETLAREDQTLSMTGDTVAADFDTTIGTLDSLTEEGSGMNSRDASGEAGNRPLDDVLTSIERREILAALRRANGQRTLAAQLLRISRSRLYRRMEALGIDPRKLGPHGEV